MSAKCPATASPVAKDPRPRYYVQRLHIVQTARQGNRGRSWGLFCCMETFQCPDLYIWSVVTYKPGGLSATSRVSVYIVRASVLFLDLDMRLIYTSSRAPKSRSADAGRAIGGNGHGTHELSPHSGEHIGSDSRCHTDSRYRQGTRWQCLLFAAGFKQS